MVKPREFMVRGINKGYFSSYKKKMPKSLGGVGGYPLHQKSSKSFLNRILNFTF